MAIQGQRFRIDLDDDQNLPQQGPRSAYSTTRSPWNLVADIQERPPLADVRSPSPPKTQSSQTGFPAHKRRSKPSAFKQRMSKRSDGNEDDGPPRPQTARPDAVHTEEKTNQLDDRQEIDMENRQRLAEMSPDDIDQARKELMSGLSESLIERLLKKADIEEDQNFADDRMHSGKNARSSSKIRSNKKVTFDSTQTPPHDDTPNLDPEDIPSKPPPDIQPVSSFRGWPVPPSFHFPQPPTPPSLDPEDPEFLSKLHSTYFPSLPSNPNALSWMQPPDPAENEAYSPSREDLFPSAVRFDFRGRLLPPRLAAQIPTTQGLHHHGTAPEAAGYTVPELAHLSRSSFPSQRCIAYQTLGRILYRLGTGVFGPEDHELCQGLWKCIEQGRVLDTLTAEAARDGESGNRSCWVTATEAVWLWRKGGGRKWKAT
ncbi:MAG: hypothetical protein LQ338_001802 [Usnochroma carphineum]|nr:MAG: hypothetical protein LQ338_001802 [Usnochroma carphineum]